MTVSVVIPALDEEELVVGAVESALREEADEVIVADGGSQDGTIRVASPLARIVRSRQGRARQMNAGAEVAAGDILIFLHADTRLTEGSVDAARRVIAGDAGAGCFRLRFDTDSVLLRLYGAFTALPLKSLCFGDRALFISRELFETIGGYADIPIFEDLDIVRRVSRLAPFVFTHLPVVTSSRRFADKGPVRQQALNFALWTGYHAGLSPHRLARFYRYENAETYRSE